MPAPITNPKTGSHHVSDLMSKRVITLQSGESLLLAEKTMALAKVRHMPVVDKTRLVGLVTYSDILKASRQFPKDLEKRSVLIRDIVANDILAIRSEALTTEASALMLKNKYGCLPVVDATRTLVGIVTQADFMRHFLSVNEGESDEHPSETEPDPPSLLRAVTPLPAEVKKVTAEEVLAQMDVDLLAHLSASYLRHLQVLPVRIDGECVVITTLNPSGAFVDLADVFGAKHVELLLLDPADFVRVWRQLSIDQDLAPLSEVEKAELIEGSLPHFKLRLHEPISRVGLLIKKLRELADSEIEQKEKHYQVLLDAMVADSVARRATDLHLEQFGTDVVVRVRIDGALRTLRDFALQTHDMQTLVNVVKVRSNLDLSEHRRPQGGRFHAKVGGAEYDIRVQVQPSLWAEHVVLRFLPRNASVRSIPELGLSEDVAKTFLKALIGPSGLVLVVGPTGCGKSTTLYAGLHQVVADHTRKVISAEDPIEYNIDHMQQVEIHPQLGFGFADAMRSFVRQDPDVIFIGEIRDHDTALETIRASQTGHLVLSTLHTNNSVESVQRLADLGVHLNSIASELVAIYAQRLVRKNCPSCREPAKLDPRWVADNFPPGFEINFVTYRGRGCSECGFEGTQGRTAVVKYLPVDAVFRDTISKGGSLEDLRQAAIKSGLRSHHEAAIALVRAGTIPLSELPRVFTPEQLIVQTN